MDLRLHPDNVADVLNKLIQRSEEWMEDSKARDDWHDYYFYKGQKELSEFLKGLLLNENIISL